MEIKLIKTDLDYQAALKEIEGLINAQPDTPEGDHLDIMTTIIDNKELEEKLLAALDDEHAQEITSEFFKGL